jgi:hypothetical protein
MSDDELRITRRLFLQHSAMSTAMAAGWYSVAMKTDALAQAQQSNPLAEVGFPETVSPYAYEDPPS